MVIRTLSMLDVPQANQLSNLAGWNQTKRDWQRILSLEPEGCFCIVMDGCVVATTTAIRYEGRLAWIGMVLTHPDYRRLGFARLLMEHALRWLHAQDIAIVKLDATDDGRTLYASLGFTDECAVERWIRPPGLSKHPVLVLPCDPVFEMDRAAFGLSRIELLNLLREETCAGSPELGFAICREGALGSYFGPCVATSQSNASRFVDWFCALHPDRQLIWDLFPQNQAAKDLATEFHFLPRRSLVRMSLSLQPGIETPATNPLAYYAIAGFEYG